MSKEIIALLLAGGKGTRLGVITRDLAKPSVPFGGEYYLIDFPLSNCSNSAIDTVGVLTQYEPLILHSTLGEGSSWELDSRDGGLTVLPPYVKGEGGGQWYLGTANAVFQNIEYVDIYDPEYVLILSADHIYKMDYRKMLNYHKENNADASVAVIRVPWDMAPKFGIMNTDHENKIVEFKEKPSDPKSNLASMGIYIFNWQILKESLINDNANLDSDHDFGKDIIPCMLENNYNIFAYQHDSYWMDVGTVKSYWEAHMDLLSEDPELDLYDREWVIYSQNPHLHPLYISPEANINNSMVNKGSRIFGDIDHSVVFYGVEVEKGARIKDSVIMPNVKIGKNTVIERAVICQETEIGDDCIIGAERYDSCAEEEEITVVGSQQKLRQGTEIMSGEEVS